jgi:hypothetical protein
MLKTFQIDLDQDTDGIAIDLVLASSAVFHTRFSGGALAWEQAMRTLARKIEEHVHSHHLVDPNPPHSGTKTPQ